MWSLALTALLVRTAMGAGGTGRAGAIQVACVGDSITAGYLATTNHTYPQVLQQLLDAKYGTASYNVMNFGAGGATVQKHADSPYWNRTQYAQWVNGSYDVIIIMLGTNDAKDPGNGGAPNWPTNCTAAHPTAANCSVISDYLSLINVARTKGRGARTPKNAPVVALMRPPPLWRDSDYGMNETVLNDVMPRLVPQIASMANISPANIIDVYTALGGTAQWKKTYPVCGCARSGQTGASADAIGHLDPNSGYNFSMTEGFLPLGTDFASGNFSFAEAAAECGKAVGCAGFTFKDVANTSTPVERVNMYLKKCGNGLHKAEGWWTWLKPQADQPHPKQPVTQPHACALFCDETSCDACHPNNNGYTVLAETVFDFVVSVHSTLQN